jgi:cell division protein ZapD
LKELERQLSLLREYQTRPGVDTGRLRSVMAALERRRDELQAAGGNFLARLRDSDFLTSIKHRSAIPGGTCEFDLPDYFHWLNLPADVRRREFNEWLAMIRPLCEGVSDLLWVARENARPRREVAAQGTFQVAFDKDSPSQLLRILLPADSSLYPEISGSHHRCSIRFLNWTDVNSRPVQATGDVSFVLACCA